MVGKDSAALVHLAVGGDYYGPDSTKEYKGAPIKVKERRDLVLEKQLRPASEELTNCNYNL